MDINAYLLQRYNVLKVFMYTALVITFIFVPVNFIQGRTALGIIEALVFLVNLIALIKFKKIIQSRYRETFVISYSILLLVTYVLLFLGGSVENMSYMHLVLIPVIGYLTNSFKNGFRLTAFFITVSVGIYLYNTQIKSGSTNYVQVLNVIVLVLDMWIVIHMYEKIRLNITDKLIKLTTTDPLTKLKNRSEFYRIYYHHENVPICLLMLDIDNLKDINDTYGHLAGDVTLISIAEIIRNNQPDEGYSFRMGDDLFAILITNANAEDYLITARKIFTEIDTNKVMFRSDVIPLKVSIALTDIVSDCNNADELMTEALRLLKQAKQSETDKIALV